MCLLSSLQCRMRPTPPRPLSCEQAASFIVRMRSMLCTPIVRRRGGEEERRSTLATPPLLFSSVRGLLTYSSSLAVEEAAYLRDRGQGGVDRLLHCEEERRHMMEYTAYSSSQCRRWPTPHPPLCTGGRGVGSVLNCDKIVRWRGGVQCLQYSISRMQGLVA